MKVARRPAHRLSAAACRAPAPSRAHLRARARPHAAHHTWPGTAVRPPARSHCPATDAAPGRTHRRVPGAMPLRRPPPRATRAPLRRSAGRTRRRRPAAPRPAERAPRTLPAIAPAARGPRHRPARQRRHQTRRRHRPPVVARIAGPASTAHSAISARHAPAASTPFPRTRRRRPFAAGGRLGRLAASAREMTKGRGRRWADLETHPTTVPNRRLPPSSAASKAHPRARAGALSVPAASPSSLRMASASARRNPC